MEWYYIVLRNKDNFFNEYSTSNLINNYFSFSICSQIFLYEDLNKKLDNGYVLMLPHRLHGCGTE